MKKTGCHFSAFATTRQILDPAHCLHSCRLCARAHAGHRADASGASDARRRGGGHRRARLRCRLRLLWLRLRRWALGRIAVPHRRVTTLLLRLRGWLLGRLCLLRLPALRFRHRVVSHRRMTVAAWFHRTHVALTHGRVTALSLFAMLVGWSFG